MQRKALNLLFVAAAVLVQSSCVAPAPSATGTAAPTLGSTSEPLGAKVSTRSQWLEANYDLVGFPIYGFYYGKPIYGYNEYGSPIMNATKISSGCYVPSWEPQSGYKGKYYYPSYVVRTARPRNYPQGHQPTRRPSVEVARRPIIIN